ncbi:patatin-like phospholipase family protein [Rhodoligotrophos defluvii]|uniref:patatin-like phospholipase family protein n=1 Tax=Rhodoligotrophos defluvii TaxID=2561934 RepID=UPI0010C940CE|nr:patatin-like phospholipase family protein [Rhodoligotrophos defluvii]
MITSLLRAGAIVLLSAGLVACTSFQPRHPVPPAELRAANPAGYPQIRFWGDVLPDTDDAAATLQAAHRAGAYRGAGRAPHRLDFLAISGGGENGAFGAGVLAGWSLRGSRPRFEVVTGVSTGALIGALAFLGPSRDAQLTALYTQYGGQHIMRWRGLLPVLLGGESLADDAPLAGLIARTIDAAYLDEVATEHRRGRRFFVATTNLDAQRPVIWDMGAIAASGEPGRLTLFRSVLLASASVPGFFPPVRIAVAANGAHYDELHVDGSVSANAFIFPALFMKALSPRGQHVPRQLYVIHNGKLSPEYSPTKPSLLPTIARSLNTLTKAHGIGDLFRLYALAQAHGLAFRMAAIPADFEHTGNTGFDVQYMQALYRRGYAIGRSGAEWMAMPPALGFERYKPNQPSQRLARTVSTR